MTNTIGNIEKITTVKAFYEWENNLCIDSVRTIKVGRNVITGTVVEVIDHENDTTDYEYRFTKNGKECEEYQILSLLRK